MESGCHTGDKRKLVNKFDGPFRETKVTEKDPYPIESIEGVRGFKRFKAVVTVDSLRQYGFLLEVCLLYALSEKYVCVCMPHALGWQSHMHKKGKLKRKEIGRGCKLPVTGKNLTKLGYTLIQ